MDRRLPGVAPRPFPPTVTTCHPRTVPSHSYRGTFALARFTRKHSAFQASHVDLLVPPIRCHLTRPFLSLVKSTPHWSHLSHRLMLLFSWYLSLSKIVLFTYLFSVFLSKRHENKNLQSLCLAQSKEIKRKKKNLLNYLINSER